MHEHIRLSAAAHRQAEGSGNPMAGAMAAAMAEMIGGMDWTVALHGTFDGRAFTLSSPIPEH